MSALVRIGKGTATHKTSDDSHSLGGSMIVPSGRFACRSIWSESHAHSREEDVKPGRTFSMLYTRSKEATVIQTIE